MSLKIEIVTPESRVYSDTADSITLPTTTGEIDILPGHIPLITQITSGYLQLKKAGTSTSLVIGDGFAQIENDTVNILAEHAINEAQIDPAAAEKAMQRAQQTLETTKADPAEFERNEKLIRFLEAQLRRRPR